MFGPITSLSITSKKLTLDDFRTLTVNRNVNKGTLVVRRDEENKIVGLECACHHDFLKSLNKPELITPATSKDLEEQFLDVVNRELDAIGDRLKDGATVAPSEGHKAKIDSRIAALKAIFESEMKNAVARSEFKSLPRKDIGKLVVALEALKGCDVATLTDDELKAFVSGSWKVGDFSLAEVDSVPSDTETLNGISDAIQAFVRKVFPGVGDYATIIENSHDIQKLINQLTYDNYSCNFDKNDCEQEYQSWSTSLRKVLIGNLHLDIEGQLKPLFKEAFDACVDGKRVQADAAFGEMVAILDEQAQRIRGQIETKAHAFGTVTERYGLTVEMESTMTVIMKLVADHGLEIDSESIWGMFALLEHQGKDDWKVFKELGCDRLDTFIAYRTLTKQVKALLDKPVEQESAEKKNADKDEPVWDRHQVKWTLPKGWSKEVKDKIAETEVEQSPSDTTLIEEEHEEGNADDHDDLFADLTDGVEARNGNPDQVKWSGVLMYGGRDGKAVGETEPTDTTAVANDHVGEPSEDESPATAFGGDLKLKYSWNEFGSKATAGDAFDPATTPKERNAALADSVRKACMGKHFRTAVCHVFNEIALRHRELVFESEQDFRDAYGSDDYPKFLSQFADEYEDNEEFKNVKELCEDIQENFTLYPSRRSYISNKKVESEIVNALNLLIAMYGDQAVLEKVDEKNLAKFLQGSVSWLDYK